MKNTKIVCTIGPASEKKTMIDKMLKAGMNVARLNFSHGDYKAHLKLIKTLREQAAKQKKSLAILQDLQGPRIRIGKVDKNGIELVRKDKVMLVHEDIHEGKLFAEAFKKGYKILPMQYADLYKYTKKGTSILINDGLIDLRVEKVEDQIIYAHVVKPGIIFTNKGINLPGVKIKTKVITDKDREDLKFGLKNNVDFVALSFVQGPENIEELKRLLQRHKDVKIIAKIETQEAVKNFDKILKLVDGIMVARGDLGIELPVDEVPLIQKRLIKKCLTAAKPVIVATQMLDSMILNPRPTRAEVSDVANAVIDHADALMLSGESAYGKYPLESVRMMKQIILETEASIFDDLPRDFFKLKETSIADSVAASVRQLVYKNKAKAVVINSCTGSSARLLSRYRPETVIALLTNDLYTYRQSALSWGMYAYKIPTCKTLDTLIKKSVAVVKKEKIARKGDRIIIFTGQPLAQKEGISLVKVHTI